MRLALSGRIYRALFSKLALSFAQREILQDLTLQRGFHVCFVVRRRNFIINWLIRTISERENLPRLPLFGGSQHESADSEVLALRPRSVFSLNPLQARRARERLERKIENLPAKTALVPVSLFAGKGPKPIQLQPEGFSFFPFAELWALGVLVYYRKELELEITSPIPFTSQRREDLNRASRALHKSEKVRRGAAEHSEEQIERIILSGQEFETLLADLSDSELLSYSELKIRAKKILTRMRGKTSGTAIIFFKRILTPVLNRIFSGIEVQGLDNLREELKNNPVVVLPNHRSHFDYLLLSYVFYRENLPLPFIAAGDNLNFPPVGFLLRRVGAFFIKRRSERDPLYRFVLSNYVKYLMKRGHLIEFFIEGGRSRSGLPREPKVGLLKYIVLGVHEGERRDVSLVPVSITYERIPEEQGLTSEMSGEKKRSESLASIFRASKLLKQRFGTVSVSFGEGLGAKTLSQQLLHDSAIRVVRKQADLSTITPLSLLAAARHTLQPEPTAKELQSQLTVLFIEILRWKGVHTATPESSWDDLETPHTLGLNISLAWCLAGKTISEGMSSLLDLAAEKFPSFPADSATLEYYKNQLVALFYSDTVNSLLAKATQDNRESIASIFKSLSPFIPAPPTSISPLLEFFLRDALVAGIHALDLSKQGDEEVEGEDLLLDLRSKNHLGFRHYSELVQTLILSWRDLSIAERDSLRTELQQLLNDRPTMKV